MAKLTKKEQDKINLIAGDKDHPKYHALTAEEQKRGAQKSVEVRREKAKNKERHKTNLKAIARTINESGVESLKDRAVLEKYGVDDEDMTNGAVIVMSVYGNAKKGNMQAVDKWIELTEDAADDKQTYELPARVIGKAFVDINRDIQPNIHYVFEGGRGGLKSSFVSLKVIELLKNNPNMHAIAIRKVGETMKDSVYAQLSWAITELGLTDEFKFTKSPLEIEYKKTGQKIYFRGIDKPEKLKSIKPPFGYIGITWIEEEDQLSGEDEERNVKQSVQRGGDVIYDFSSYNPPKSKANWVNKRKLVPNDKRIIHHSHYKDAPREWLGQKFIDDAEHLKETNPEAYEHEYDGIANGDGGNVFEYLEIREITDEEMQRFDHIYGGIDFGWYPDAFCYLRIAYEAAQEKIYLMDELYVNKWSNEKTGQWIIDHGYDDFIITCDSAEPKSINDLKDMGLPARGAIKGPGSVEYGFKWLQRRTIVIDPARTPHAYKEITEYEYARDKEDNIVSGYPDGNDHAISALRYGLEQYFNRRGNSA